LAGTPEDLPTTGHNPLRGESSWSQYHTVANAKGIYNDLLTYFSGRQDKMFVVVTAPPLMNSETDPAGAANVRAFNDWLVDDWLEGYAYNDAAVFDFFNVLPSKKEGRIRRMAVDERCQKGPAPPVGFEHTEKIANLFYV
jgi:hypothetical protein